MKHKVKIEREGGRGDREKKSETQNEIREEERKRVKGIK